MEFDEFNRLAAAACSMLGFYRDQHDCMECKKEHTKRLDPSHDQTANATDGSSKSLNPKPQAKNQKLENQCSKNQQKRLRNRPSPIQRRFQFNYTTEAANTHTTNNRRMHANIASDQVRSANGVATQNDANAVNANACLATQLNCRFATMTMAGAQTSMFLADAVRYPLSVTQCLLSAVRCYRPFKHQITFSNCRTLHDASASIGWSTLSFVFLAAKKAVATLVWHAPFSYALIVCGMQLVVAP